MSDLIAPAAHARSTATRHSAKILHRFVDRSVHCSTASGPHDVAPFLLACNNCRNGHGALSQRRNACAALHAACAKDFHVPPWRLLLFYIGGVARKSHARRSRENVSHAVFCCAPRSASASRNAAGCAKVHRIGPPIGASHLCGGAPRRSHDRAPFGAPHARLICAGPALRALRSPQSLAARC